MRLFEDGVLGAPSAALDDRRDRSAKRSSDWFSRLRDVFGGTAATGSGILTTSGAWANPHVRACIHANASALAGCPLVVYKGDDRADSHWAAQLFDQPNRTLRLNDYKLKYQTFAIQGLFGEVFWVLDRAGLKGRPKEIWIYNPGLVSEVINRQTGELVGWEFTLEGKKFRILPQDVLHFPIFDPTKHNPKRPSRGTPPLAAALLAASSDQAAARFNLDFFTRGINPGAVFVNSDEMQPDNREEFLSRLRAQYRGKGHEAMLLDGGTWDVKQIGTNARDAEFIAGRALNRSDIAEVYGVPPVVLGKDDASYANADIQITRWWTGTLIPNGKDFCATVDQGLIDEPGVETDLSTEHVEELQKAKRERIASAVQLWEKGVPWANLDERFDLGLGEFEGKDVGYLPFSVVPVGEASIDVEDDEETNETPADPKAPAADAVPTGGEGLQEGLATSTTLNGIQVTAALEVLEKIKNGDITDEAAIPLLVGLGIPREEAEAMVASMHTLPADEPEPVVVPVGAPPADPEEKNLEKALGDFLETTFAPAATVRVPTDGTWSERSQTIRVIVPGASRAINAPALKSIVKLIRDDDEKLKALSASFFKQGMQVGIDQMAETIGVDVKFDLKNPKAQAFLAEKAIRIVDINKTTETKLRTLFDKALEEGWSTADLAKEIKGSYNFASSRAKVIARTEISQSVSGARFMVAKDEGVEYHEWLDSNDERVRDSHAAEDGKIVKVGEPFPTTSLLYPGDMDGDPAEIINCRCVAIPAEAARALPTANRAEYWRASVAKWLPIERRYQKKLSKFLVEQRAAVLAAVANLTE